MDTWRNRLTALALAFALFPGAFEAVENLAHLMGKGHLAHLVSAKGHQEPAGDEHGCTTVFHLCTCHASLASLIPSARPAVQLAEVGFFSFSAPTPPLTDFSSSIDRPPRA